MKGLLGAVRASGLFRPTVSFHPLVRCCSSSAVAEASPLPLIRPSLRNWEDFRDLGAVVVDKTVETAAMIQPGEENFLARPRKSGKSLSLSTANAVLSAKTELFEGTKLMMAVEKGDPTVAHVAQLWDKGGVPVLHLDFSAVRASPEVFEGDLLQLLRSEAEECLGTELRSNGAPLALHELFRGMRRSGQRLAVLIDEYDQPIVKMLAQNGGKMDENVDANIRVLHEFFTALKSAFALNGYCLFMTGVSKFSRVSLFSGANTIADLSFSLRHQKAFHFSWEEVVETYPRHLEALLDAREEGTMEELRQTMEKCYGGYSFSPQALDRDSRLFNPFDVACSLAMPEECPRTGNLPDFWCRQGRVGWLAKHLDAGFIRQGLWSSAQSLDASSSLVNVEVKHLGKKPAATASLLLQTGYLTFDEYQEGGQRRTVTLRPTNSLTQEVLQDQLLESVLPPEAGLGKAAKRVQELFAAGDLLGVWQHVEGLLDVGNYHQTRNAAEAVVQWLATLLLQNTEASGEILFLRETSVMHGRSDFILCYGPRNGEGHWRYGAVVEAKFMRPATGEAVVVENASALETTEDSAAGDCGLESCTFLDKQLAKGVGGEERVRKQVRAAFEQIRDKKYDTAVPSQYETLRHAVVVWNNKAQVVAYSELSVEGH